jgi:hypothetical protein
MPDQPELTADYAATMRLAKANREQRAANAGKAVLHYLWPQLARRSLLLSSKPSDIELERWSVRGEPRTRARFADPHPDDFPGGLPLPAEYPRKAT